MLTLGINNERPLFEFSGLPSTLRALNLHSVSTKFTTGEQVQTLPEGLRVLNIQQHLGDFPEDLFIFLPRTLRSLVIPNRHVSAQGMAKLPRTLERLKLPQIQRH